MDKADCTRERISSRSLGLALMALGLVVAMVGALIVPVFGIFFAVPVLILAGVLIAAPESKVCKLITGRAGG